MIQCRLPTEAHRIDFMVNGFMLNGRIKNVGNTNMVRITWGLSLILVNTTFGVAQTVNERLNPSVRSAWSRLPVTKTGEPIASQFVDPFMTTGQADRIHEFLCEPSVFQWNGETTLFDIQRDLARYLPVGLDLRALEVSG